MVKIPSIRQGGLRLYFCLLMSCLVLVGMLPRRAYGQTGDSTAKAIRTAETLRPGDVVRVRIWEEETLSGESVVDEDGYVALPKLGLRQVTQQSTGAVKAELFAAYARILKNAPEIVFLKRIAVWGAVMKPGLYSVDPTMSVADVVVLAGGASPQGRRDRVQLIRNGVRVTSELGVETLVASSRLQSGDQLYVPEKSWITRNSGLTVGIASLVLTLYRVIRP